MRTFGWIAAGRLTVASVWLASALLHVSAGPASNCREAHGRVPAPTKEFEIRDDLPYLGGEPVELWGIRCGNALHSDTVVERHVRALDNMTAHGINLIGVYLQGSNGGWPDSSAGTNGFDRLGNLKSSAKRRLEWLVREADARGMVVMVGICSPRKDQDFEDEDAIRNALEQTASFLDERGLRNVFVDLMHEYSHGRVDQDLFREPDGEAKKMCMTQWFHRLAPQIEVGVCPYVKSDTLDRYPGMDVRIIQKDMPIPESGFVVNVETQKKDSYENDGVFTPEDVQHVLADCERFAAEPRAVMIFHAAFIQGIGNFSGTAPHPEMGGYGQGVNDRGVRFYYDWVRSRYGRWEFPRHRSAPFGDGLAVPVEEHRATREFEIRDGLPFLGGEPVELWGLRCSNALMSSAVTERLIYELDNMAAHGINLIGISLQGTNGGFPDKEAGPNAFTPDGRLLESHGTRLEQVLRAADERGMVVCLTLMMPRKDQGLRDAAAVRVAIRSTGEFLEERQLRNVFVNLFHEFDHPTRVDHEVFREPDGARKKADMAELFHGVAPGIEVGVCPNHASRTDVAFPGCDVLLFQERMPIPEGGFAVNVETADRDLSGNEGVFDRFDIESMQAEWALYLDDRRTAFLFRSPFVESVRGVLGTGPNFAIGGRGTDTTDRGVAPFYDWMLQHVGPWTYPKHQRP